MKKIIILLMSCFSTTYAISQSFYDESTVQSISITFAQSNWDALLDAEKAGAENYIMAQSVTINGVVFDSVGVKYKGNSTYNSNQVKNPFHIELDTYKDHNYQGYKDIKLSNVANDPSFVREVLSYKVLRNYMDAPLSNYANVSVNGNLIGLYSNSEAISKTFVNDRFGSKKNTFVKCNPPAGAGPGSSDYPNLVYLGTDSTTYYAKYEIKSDYGWNELIHLCDTLANHTTNIEDILDVDRALWMLAFNNVLVNLDSYSGGFAQNYYLYRDDNGRFLPIVWDLNESFGVFSMTGTGTLNNTTAKQQMSHLLNSTSSSYPLISKLLNVPTYKKMYLAHMKTMLQDNFTNNGLYFTQGQAMQSTISSSVQADQNKFYTFANFTSNLTTDITSGGGGPPRPGASTPGITNLMNGRYSYLMGLSDFSTTEPSISSISVSNSVPTLNDTVHITANIINETSAVLRYRNIANAPFERVTMFDDGMHNDGAANDNVYGASVVVTSAELEYYIYAENNTIGKFSPTNAEHEFYSLNTLKAAIGDIVINEFLASNSTTNTDQDGDYDDWVEIYNNGTQAIDISGYRLTDDISDFDQFTFPVGTTIQPNGYVTVWADKDLTQSGFHADFKISSSGETLILSDPTLTIVDSITFGSQVGDVSYGRFANGTGSFQFLTPTFGSQNLVVSAPIYDVVINEFLASNTAVIADSYGDFDDWIELYNKGNTTIDLSAFSLSDDITDLDLFKFPSGTMLMPDSFIIVWADKDSAQILGTAGYHADFKLSSGGEVIYLSDGATIVDSVSYSAQVTDISNGRFPNGTGTFQFMTPTFGAQNMLSSAANYDVVINEFMASNTSIIADSYGDFDDWIELFNKGNATVDLSTFSLSDDISDLDVFKFPNGTMLMPDSFIVVWADKDSAQMLGTVGYHADFKLSAAGESIYLSDGATVVDSVNYLIQVTDSSYGRLPNGTGSFQRLFPTFGAINLINTGLNGVALKEVNFTLFPNPANESFTVTLNDNEAEDTQIQVFNNVGQQILFDTVNRIKTVDISTWAKGLYFVQVGSTTTRIIVQ